jgi:endonuclease/exonuclease/phosphatase (EEP) superfamily protein YafD
MVWKQKLATFLCSTLLFLTAIATFCTFGGWSYWPERLSHFQLQYWLGAVFLTLLLLLLRRRIPMLIGLFCIAMLSTHILTWYLPSMGTAPPFVKVMFSNVWLYNKRYEDVLSLVRTEKPDILGVTEVDQAWVQQLDRLQDILPYRTEYGGNTVVYSKFNLAGTEILDRDPRFPQTVIIRNLLQDNQRFTLVATHPSSPHNRQRLADRNAHLENLALYLDQFQDNLIMIGDFNTSPWSPYYRQFVDRARLVSARQGFGLYPTWAISRVRQIPDFLQPLLSVPIDHAFIRSGNLKLRSLEFHTGPYVGSDHLPIITTIGTMDS